MSATTSLDRIRVGLISDTHGVLRPEALDALRGSDFIVHAGDIVDPGILGCLAALAPVTAVRGNNDQGTWAAAIPETAVLDAGRVRIYVLHDLARLSVDLVAAGFHVVVSGHSHRPRIEERNGVLYINPGSAGPRRFTLPVSIGELVISGRTVRPQLFTLSIGDAASQENPGERRVRSSRNT
jgi:putative phosphoesterase